MPSFRLSSDRFIFLESGGFVCIEFVLNLPVIKSEAGFGLKWLTYKTDDFLIFASMSSVSVVLTSAAYNDAIFSVI